MKIIICDVGDAACAIVTAKSGYTMMVDCGSKSDKTNPVDTFMSLKKWLGVNDYVTKSGVSYPLALLHITHPDDDHVRNATRIKNELPPYLLRNNDFELFTDGANINSEYKEKIDKVYRGNNPEIIPWGFDVNEDQGIPVNVCRISEDLKSKERNNSSIIRYIKQDGLGILFCGDLEKAGWEYFVEHYSSFVQMLKDEGVNVLVAPHHGHKSGFPKVLFDAIGNVDMVILSKDTEVCKDVPDVSTQYSNYSNGWRYKALSDKNMYFGKVLTTRSNGNIYIESTADGFNVWTDKASSNHEKIE